MRRTTLAATALLLAGGFLASSPADAIVGGSTAADGELVPVPEPSTWAAGILAFCAVGYTQRRRFQRLTQRA